MRYWRVGDRRLWLKAEKTRSHAKRMLKKPHRTLASSMLGGEFILYIPYLRQFRNCVYEPPYMVIFKRPTPPYIGASRSLTDFGEGIDILFHVTSLRLIAHFTIDCG
jgi:hypothetical protein